MTIENPETHQITGIAGVLGSVLNNLKELGASKDQINKIFSGTKPQQDPQVSEDADVATE